MEGAAAARIQDPQRLRALWDLRLLDTPTEAAFDRLAKLAARVLNTPVALVSLVDRNRQFFKSCIGLPEPWSRWRETPLSHSFCQHVVATGNPLIVPDARQSPDLRDNRAIAELDVVAYLGCPMILPNGQVIGSFCVIDSKPRNWSDADAAIVRDLTASVMTEIELRHIHDQLEERVRERESLYRELVELAADGIFVSDEHGRLVEVNQAGCELLGYTRAQVLQRTLVDLLPPEDRIADPPRLDILRDGRTFIRERRLLRHDGAVVPVEVHVKQLSGRRIQGIVRDITERQRHEREREAMVRELTARNADMENFIYTISHDLKTPLVTIAGFASLISKDLEEGDFAKSRVSLDEIHKAVAEMGKHIQDLLLLTRIAHVPVEKKSVLLDELVRSLLKVHQPRFEQAGAHTRLLNKLPTVTADPTDITRVFNNLLDNALKYRRPDVAPVIEIGAERIDQEWRLYVRDNGQGIKPEYQQRIFGLFQRADSRIEGTGVGLAISKRVIEAHGGRMWVESVPGEGSTFWIGLPASLDVESGGGA